MRSALSRKVTLKVDEPLTGRCRRSVGLAHRFSNSVVVSPSRAVLDSTVYLQVIHGGDDVGQGRNVGVARVARCLAGGVDRRKRLSDRQLLTLYLESKDEDAFAELLRRHGPRVQLACRQVLAEPSDVEDAFQATFVTLVRRARWVNWRGDLGSWLFIVAHRTAVRFRKAETARRQRDRTVSGRRSGGTPAPFLHEAQTLLHDELDRMPETQRQPLLLCYFDGLSRDQAARQLGWSLGSLKGRLERGRVVLRKRLERRGLSPSVGLLAVLAGGTPAEAIPRRLVTAALDAVRKCSPMTVQTVAKGVVMSMCASKLPSLAAAVLMILTATCVVAGPDSHQAATAPAQLAAHIPPQDELNLPRMRRTIRKEPQYHSAAPKYCLLVFGPEAKTRVWLVQDGATLFVDRNGNGDLTEPGKRVDATPGEGTDTREGVYRFDLGDVADGELLHRRLWLSVGKLDRAGDEPIVRDHLKKYPDARSYRLGVDVEMPGRTRLGRIEQRVGNRDLKGVLRFGDTPGEAPVIHFAGTWQLSFHTSPRLIAGREKELVVFLTTPGVGPGTTVLSGYEQVVPELAFPRVTLEYPAPSGGTPVRKEHILRKRCCTFQLYDTISVPAGVSSGKARVTLSFDGWPDGGGVPTRHDVDVVPPRPGPPVEAVSGRLRQTFMHPDQEKGHVSVIRYSPDGKRILAGHFPGGTVQVWDADTGSQLARIETGSSHSSAQFFEVSPDWKTLLAARDRHEIETVQKDGKKLKHFQFDSDLRTWDLATGELQERWQHETPRYIAAARLSPDGTLVHLTEQPSGEFETHPPVTASLLDLNTKELHPLPEGRLWPTFSPDGKTLLTTKLDKWLFANELVLTETTSQREKVHIPIEGPNTLCFVNTFSPDGKYIIGSVRVHPKKDDRSTWQASLKCWETATGKLVIDYPLEPNTDLGAYRLFSRDGSRFYCSNWTPSRADPKLGAPMVYVFDIPNRRLLTTILLPCPSDGEHLPFVGAPVLSPDGNWLVLTTQARPRVKPSEEETVAEEDIPQGRLHLIDTRTNAIRETLVTPPGFSGVCCFSPDGKTLATGASNRVLLWDFTHLPGAARP